MTDHYRRHQVTLIGDDGVGNTAKLLVGGKDISSTVSSLRLDVSAWDEHRLTVQLCSFPLDAQLQGVRVRVDDETADVLRWLGWTPPPEEATG